MQLKATKTKVFIIFLLLPLLFIIITWKVSTNQIQKLCEEFPMLKPPIQVAKIVIENKILLGYIDTTIDYQKFLTIRSAYNYGQYTCTVYYENDKVTKTEFVYLD